MCAEHIHRLKKTVISNLHLNTMKLADSRESSAPNMDYRTHLTGLSGY
ncbi:predicted protein [Botrytis cinerea T4]|uniref:Uncharacterized protein n=1 Tax=Botryotinia fuckeliana (strain T4) TaxID=999810 RepID=G2Y609_BOTF4|nr:predicted protein [Botrytis cinerea T4]